MSTWKETLQLVDKVSKPLNEIGKKANNTTSKLDRLKKSVSKLNEVSKRYANTSRKMLGAIGKLAGGLAGLVGAGGVITTGINKVVDFSDNIDKMSQKIDMTAESYQEWDYIMSQNGGNVDSLQMGYKTLATQMNGVKKGTKESIKAFRQLGVRITNTNGKFRTQEEVFNDVITALQNETNETKKAILGNQIFGKSFIEMKPLLNQTASATENLRKKAHDLGLIMSKEDIKASVDFKDTMDTLTRFMQAQMNKAIVPMIPKLQELADKFMQNKDRIKKLAENVGEFAIKIFELIEFLNKNTWILKTAGVITGIVAVVNVLTTAVEGLTFAFLILSANPISLTVMAWTAGITALIAGIVALVKWIKKLRGESSAPIDINTNLAQNVDSQIKKGVYGSQINKNNNSVNNSHNTTNITNNYSSPLKTNYMSPAYIH